MITEVGKYLFVIIMGVFFAVLQTCYFFQLEIWLTAAYPSFLTIMLGWLVGSIAGLIILSSSSRVILKSCRTWLVLSIGAYYSVIGLLQTYPYRMKFLPIYGILIGISGVLAGRFFVEFRLIFKTTARLFFMENNGFVLGWILGFWGFVWYGHTFNLVAPLALGLVCFTLLLLVLRNGKVTKSY